MVDSTKEKDETKEDSNDESTIDDIREDVTGNQKDKSTERFVEIEEDVRKASTSVLSDGEIVKGQIRDAKRISLSKVPDDYPSDMKTEKSLRLSVELQDGKDANIYLNWPDGDSPKADSEIGKILSLHSLKETEIAELQGKSILLEVEDGYYRPNVPNNKAKGKDSYREILITIILTYGAIGIAPIITASISVILFTIGTILAIPYFTYKDSYYLRNNSDWRGGPLLWITLSFIPILNIISTIIYTIQRRNATFL